MFTPDLPQAPQTGAMLRAMRTATGLSLAQVAERAGTTKPTLSRFERGQRVISADLLERVLRVIKDEMSSGDAA